jgi:flavorubredoxin
MNKKITEKVTWVGKIDWELRRFHGDELSTHKGTSYNSYLIKDEKNVLIDTAWEPYDKEFVANLKKEIDLKDIDYIVLNHGEIDHSGSLVALMNEIPDTPIYCTANGVKSLKGHYHKDWNFVPVKTGDTLDIGSSTLTFVEARMLHWPDTMFTYMSEDNILFSTDAFGQHYASEQLFNDLVDQDELFAEALKYYANILTPFNKMVLNKIKEVVAMNLPLDYICTSHGVIWRDNPAQIIEKYIEWAGDYKEDQISILYDTMWDGTRRMAEAISRGIQAVDKDVRVKQFNLSKTDKNDILSEVFKSKAILVGSPTVNKGITYATAGVLEMIKGLSMKNKKAGAFGTYGWSGESVKIISEWLEEAGFKLPVESVRAMWNPDEAAIEAAEGFGKEFAKECID